MAFTRIFGVALAAALTAGVLASAAPAVVRPVTAQTLTTTHFIVHYDSSVLPSGAPALDYTTETQAGDIAAYAERAYALYRSWGWPAPPDDGDGHIDIYVKDLSQPPPAEESYASPDNGPLFPSPDTADFTIAAPAQINGFATTEGMSLDQEEQRTIAVNVFYMFEDGIWVPNSGADLWLIEGAAEWAGLDAIGFPASGPVLGLGNPDIALNCGDATPGQQKCDPDPFINGGYARWAFFQQLASEYGTTFVENALVNGALGQSSTTALSNAIAAKGSTLSSQYNTYVTNLMNGNFGIPAIAAVRPPVQASVIGGVATATLPAVKVPVNHLSARYVTFQRGDGDGSHACYAATLSISVAMPAGTSAQPYYFWDFPGSTPQALSVSGSNASITVPWDTCDWGTARGWLSIANAGTTVDAADFTITSSVTVDLNTPATASPPPVPSSIWGTPIPVPTADVPPSIDVFGPELLQLSAKTPTIRLIVDSSGSGMVTATLGATVLGNYSLRAGNNDVRFAVPKSMLTSLRRSASASNVLTLTPMSASGNVAGQAVTRQVAIAAAPEAVKHKKKKK